jgi:hypothetical protein
MIKALSCLGYLLCFLRKKQIIIHRIFLFLSDPGHKGSRRAHNGTRRYFLMDGFTIAIF